MAVAIRVTCKTAQDSNRENMVKKKSRRKPLLSIKETVLFKMFFFIFFFYIFQAGRY